jgi:hypothetical protein
MIVRREEVDQNLASETQIRSRWLQALLLLSWIVVLGFFFANVEIQIEGGAGWAANLPTWRIENHPLLNIFWGGKPLTGYHLWIFGFMALAFHLPVFMCGQFSLRLEARIVGSVIIFWIIEDFLWFLLNPAFGLALFRPQSVPWHKHWILGMPTDYYVCVLLGSLLIWYSYRKKPEATA